MDLFLSHSSGVRISGCGWVQIIHRIRTEKMLCQRVHRACTLGTFCMFCENQRNDKLWIVLNILLKTSPHDDVWRRQDNVGFFTLTPKDLCFLFLVHRRAPASSINKSAVPAKFFTLQCFPCTSIIHRTSFWPNTRRDAGFCLEG